MKNITIAILAALVIVFAFLFFTQKKSNVSYEPWPETEPAHTTQTNNNPNGPDYTPPTPCTPSIVVTNPTAGASYTTGQHVNITWTSCGVQNVNLALVSGGKDFGEITPAPIPSSTGFYQWTAKNPGKSFTDLNTNSYQIIVEGLSGGPMVRSGTFTVTTPETIWQDSGDDANGIHAGYIKSVSNSNTNYSLKIDYVIMNNTCPPVNPGDECVTNNNPLIRTFPISSNASIKSLNLEGHPVVQNHQQFMASFSGDNSGKLYWIKIQGGVVTEIYPIYLP